MEERQAATFTHIPWPAFEEMPALERARVVAHYRMDKLLESVRAAEVDRHSYLMTEAARRKAEGNY